jgi:hypothetical protein
VILALQHGSKHRIRVAHRLRLYIEAAPSQAHVPLRSRIAIIGSTLASDF